MTAETIDRYLETNLDKYIDELSRLCAQPSISARGEGITECAELVKSMLEVHGFEAQILPTAGHPVVVGHAKGRADRTLLLYNHYDVQPPEPLELWTTPPFEPTVRDGKLFARGALDDKGEIVSRLASLDAVREANGGEFPCNITFFIEGEEEIGSPSLAPFVDAHQDMLRADGCIWEAGGIDLEGRHMNFLGLRGILAVELSVETMGVDGHSGNAHVLPNAAWRLVWALARLKGPDERIRIPGFYDGIEPPTQRDIEFMDEAHDPAEETFLREQLGVKAFTRGLSLREAEKYVFEPTCNIQGITAGYQQPGVKTVIPARASAKLDFRLVPGQDPDALLGKLREHLDNEGFSDVQIQTFSRMKAYRVPSDDPLVVLTAESAREVYGKPSTTIPLIGGSGPMHSVAGTLGVSAVLAGIGYHDNRVHAPDEHIRLQDFLNGSRHVARIIQGFSEISL